jgi:hypothetical protein
VFNWIDIGDTGTAALAAGDDENAGPLPIGFTFKYYDNQYTTFRVCSNGWLSFSSTVNSYSNAVIPSASAPLNMLAPFWDDLNLTCRGCGRHLLPECRRQPVVQWDGVMRAYLLALPDLPGDPDARRARSRTST